MSKADVLRLVGRRPSYDDPEWDAPFVRRERAQNELLSSLPDDGRYAVV